MSLYTLLSVPVSAVSLAKKVHFVRTLIENEVVWEYNKRYCASHIPTSPSIYIMSALASAHDDTSEQLHAAKRLMKNGNYDDAIAAFRGIQGAASTGSADGAELLVCLSSCYSGRTDWVTAVTCAEEAIVRNPQHARAYLALARGLHGDGKYNAAVEACDSGLRTVQVQGLGQEAALTQWRGVCQRARDGEIEPHPLRWRRLNLDGSIADDHNHEHSHEHSHEHNHERGEHCHSHNHATDSSHDHSHEHFHDHSHSPPTSHNHSHSHAS